MEETRVLRVTTLADENDGSAEVGEGLSLRDAVIIANSTPEDEIIELEAEQVYQLSISGEDTDDETAALQGDLDISSKSDTGNLTIRGLGEGAIIDAQQIDRIFQVYRYSRVGGSGENGATFTLDNVTITGGQVNGDRTGGAILVEGAGIVELVNCNITGNSASNSNGGGIHNQGSLTLRNCNVTENTAQRGGGILFNQGDNSVEIINSNISNNSATGSGGGIATNIGDNIGSSTLTVTDSTISGNTAGVDGGGIVSRDISGEIIITNTEISNNTAERNGGGIDANTTNTLSVNRSIISGNTAGGNGGGIDGTITTTSNLFRSTVVDNTAGGTGGGVVDINIIEDSTINNNQAGSLGGGVFASNGGLILNSTISNNHTDASGGGIFVSSVTQLRPEDYLTVVNNSTISGNTAKGNGGGIAIAAVTIIDRPLDPGDDPIFEFEEEVLDFGGDLRGTNLTITNNTADSDNNGDGSGGGIHNPATFIPNIDPTETNRTRLVTGNVELSNSILSGNFDSPNNSGTGNINPDISGAAKGNANNLIGNTEGLTLEGEVASETESLGQGSDIVGVDPRLGTLQDNGGLTQTHALLEESPAINGGNNELVLRETFTNFRGNIIQFDYNGDGDFDDPIDFDQRRGDFRRLVGNNVDIGSFELDPNNNPTAPTVDFSNDSPNSVYRFFNQDTRVHFYTANPAERDSLLQTNNFNFEGESYIAIDPVSGMPEPSPVYRFLNEDTGVHLYTISEAERDATQELNNFSFEGEAFFAYETEVEGSIPIYRFFNSTTGAHFYTPSEAERDNIEANLPDLEAEGIAYYALPSEI